jgi:hypothetical protein
VPTYEEDIILICWSMLIGILRIPMCTGSTWRRLTKLASNTRRTAGDCVELACSHRRPSAVLNAWWRAKRWGERMATG